MRVRFESAALLKRLQVAGLMLVPAWLCLHAQTGPEAAVGAIQRRYAQVEVVQADFRQTYRAPGMDQTESGVVFLKKPGLMRWEYREPESKLFIADGRETWLYTPRDRQVMVRRFSTRNLQSTPLRIFLGGGDLLRDFAVSWESRAAAGPGGTLSVRLTPRNDETEYSYFVVECSAGSYDLRRILIAERTGNTSEFVFSNAITNGKVDIKQFQFKVPKGVEVVRLDEK